MEQDLFFNGERQHFKEFAKSRREEAEEQSQALTSVGGTVLDVVFLFGAKL